MLTECIRTQYSSYSPNQTAKMGVWTSKPGIPGKLNLKKTESYEEIQMWSLRLDLWSGKRRPRRRHCPRNSFWRPSSRLGMSGLRSRQGGLCWGALTARTGLWHRHNAFCKHLRHMLPALPYAYARCAVCKQAPCPWINDLDEKHSGRVSRNPGGATDFLRVFRPCRRFSLLLHRNL